MFDNFSPLNNDTINSYSLSPIVLVKKLSQEEMLASTKSWEIIGKSVGDDKKNEIYQKLADDNIETLDQKAKEIASFLIVKNVVGEQKMSDLQSKNPQLKELGNLIDVSTPRASPQSIRVDLSAISQAR